MSIVHRYIMQTHSNPTAVSKRQFLKATQRPDEYLKFYLDETNVMRWYVLLSGFTGEEGEFAGGEYLVRIELPDNFPYDPPKFFMMTPQGVFKVEATVCISIGEFHKDAYPPALKAFGFCRELVNGLIYWRCIGEGINIIANPPIDSIRSLAAASAAYNRTNHAKILSLIHNSFATYSANWPAKTSAQPPAN
jgi:ubiquitin-protein ligase